MDITDLVSWDTLIAACGDRSGISTSEIIDLVPGLPGEGRNGKGMTLARLMRKHRLVSATMRFPDGSQRKGYKASDLIAARDGKPWRYYS